MHFNKFGSNVMHEIVCYKNVFFKIMIFVNLDKNYLRILQMHQSLLLLFINKIYQNQRSSINNLMVW